MSVQSHIAELERRHAALERELDEARQHPSTDGTTLRELKRQKLALKDEIVKLSTDEKVLH
ncbi:YdcH family protein [Pleomorphomonas sp. PLEO]|uniref:YdcH family protein n=1 Tax=Pleomorphomonas sp. PLEO TaxID=3239306 RepID=UPI00351F0EEC